MIRMEGVQKYFGDFHALTDINLTVPKGEVVVVLGPSGSGKSTLCRTINRLETIEEGTIHIDGKLLPAEGKELAKLRADVGMVFQQFNLFPHLTALQNVTLAPITSRGMSKAHARERGIRALERVGLADKIDAYPARLSGGQQQRVAIARALALSTDYLLFDEPTSALDPELAAEVIAVLSSLASEHRTLVVVTHSLQFARSVADRVVFVEEGKILFNGDPEHFFNSEDERLKRFVSVVGSV